MSRKVITRVHTGEYEGLNQKGEKKSNFLRSCGCPRNLTDGCGEYLKMVREGLGEAERQATLTDRAPLHLSASCLSPQ